MLSEDFGLESKNVVHRSGDVFQSEENAVLAFLLMYYDFSYNEEQEYGANIMRVKNGYTFAHVANSASTQNKSLDALS